MRRFFSLAVLTTLGLGLMAARNNAAPTKHSKRQLKLAFVTNNPSDYWTIARRGVEKAGQELGVTVDFQVAPMGTAADQARIVSDLLRQKVDGIAISPVDPANQTDRLDSTAKKTLLFTQDSDAPNSRRACFIGTDNVAAGRQAGEALKRVLPRGGTVMVFVGLEQSKNASDRIKGFKQAIAGSKIRFLGVKTDDADRARARANVSDALILNPHLAACVGLWSYNGPAILSALQDAHKIGKVKVVCFDEEDDTLQGVKSGAISATVVQQPFEMGYLSIINMAKYLNGNRSVIPESRQVFVPTRVINRNNVSAFTRQLQQLRGR